MYDNICTVLDKGIFFLQKSIFLQKNSYFERNSSSSHCHYYYHYQKKMQLVVGVDILLEEHGIHK